MMRSIAVLVTVATLLACGDSDPVPSAGGNAASGGGDGGSESIDAEGAYVGDLSVATDVAANTIIASIELDVASDGSVSGQVTTKEPTSTVGEVGSLSGSISLADVASYHAELALEMPTLGTFTAAGTLAYGEASGQLAGQLSARDEQGNLVGSTIISVHQE